MKRLSAPLLALALGLVLSAGSSAYAGQVTFTYDFTPTTNAITGDHGTNQIDMNNQIANTVTIASGPVGTDIVATNLTIHGNGSDTFNGSNPASPGVPYTIKLTLTDGPASTTLAFAGRVQGSITNGAPSLTNVFDTPNLPTFSLNGDKFTISMSSFVSANPFNANPDLITKGAIGFHIAVDGGSGGGTTNDTPEPSTLLLSCFGLGGLGLRLWRKRRSAVEA